MTATMEKYITVNDEMGHVDGVFGIFRGGVPVVYESISQESSVVTNPTPLGSKSKIHLEGCFGSPFCIAFFSNFLAYFFLIYFNDMRKKTPFTHH